MPRRHPSDPDFPHGENAGYGFGCRPKDYDCPATPSCGEAHAEYEQRGRDDRAAGGSNIDAKVSYVQRRLRETLAATSIPALEARTGLTWEQIEAVLHSTRLTMPNAEAETLDHAWSWFVHGSDTTAPDFKHGRSYSYNKLCCRCFKCRDAQRLAKKRVRCGRLTEKSIVAVPGLREHVERLSKVAGNAAVARAAGLRGDSVVREVRQGNRVRVHVAKALLAVTEADCAREAKLVPPGRTYQRSRSLQALGYPLSWQADQDPNLTLRTLSYLNQGRWVSVTVAEAIGRLYEKIGDTPASVDQHGISDKSIAQARSNARRNGCYPPASYDDNGNLDYRALPGHQWSKADNRCAEDFPLAHEAAKGGKSASQLVREGFARDKRTVDRVRSRLGLRFTYDGDGVHLHPDSVARAAWIRSMIEDYDTGARGPVEVALTIGTQYPSQMPTTHPEYIAWQATQPGVRALAWMLHARARVNALVARSTTTTKHKEAA